MLKKFLASLAMMVVVLALAGSAVAQTITFQYMTTIPEAQAVIDEAIAAFEQANPGIRVETIVVGWGDAHSQFTNSLIVGMAPDVVLLGGPWATEFISMRALAPVNQYVSQHVLDNFLESALAPVTRGDNVYGIPWEGATWGLFYRKDLFEEAGLDPNKPPTTWEELLEYAQKLTGDGRWGLVFPAGSWEATDYFMPFMWQAGNPVESYVDGRWHSHFLEDSALTAVQFYYDLIHRYGVTPQSIVNMDWEQAKTAFVSGTAAMMFNGGWVISTIKNSNPELDGKWGTAMSPAGPGGVAAYGYPNYLHIPAQSRNKEAAGKFVEFLTDASDGPSYAEQIAIRISSLFWTQSFMGLPYAQDELIKPFAESMPVARFPSLAPGFEEFRELHLNPGIQGLVLGTVTPEQFVREMHENFERINNR